MNKVGIDIFKEQINLLHLNQLNGTILQKAMYLLDLENNRVNSLIKEGRSRKRNRLVFRSETDEGVFYFKKYVNYSFLKFIQDLFRTSRAERAFEMSSFLVKHNINVVKPVLAISKTFDKSSLFVTEESKGVSLKEILKGEITKSDKSKLLNKLITTYSSLLKLKIYHRDPNLSNFLVEKGELVLIDMDDIRRKPFFSSINTFVNLEKLNRILLLCFVRNKDINFNNDDRIFILKSLFHNFYGRCDGNKLMKLLNWFTKFKMHRFLKQKNGVRKYLRGGTIKEIDSCLFGRC